MFGIADDSNAAKYQLPVKNLEVSLDVLDDSEKDCCLV
jgi:hypothetical protein